VLNRGVFSLLIVALAILASPGLVPPVAAQMTWVVDDEGVNCVVGGASDFGDIASALFYAQPGDTIRVCAGNYTEPTLYVYADYLTITGPGATPENDGVATIRPSYSDIFVISADYVVVQGLDLDATPKFPGDSTVGIRIYNRNSVSIEHNEIRNATYEAVIAYGGGGIKPRYVQVLSNNIHDNQDGVRCDCDDSAISGNTVNGGSNHAIHADGDRNVITGNVVVDGPVTALGDDLTVATNQISGGHLSVGGDRIGITDNTLSDTVEYGIWSSATSLTVARNTFARMGRPIHLSGTATIGGSASEANTFIDSGGARGDSNYLVEMVNSIDVNAEYNNWGLCTAAEIEQELYDKADDPALGRVIYEPFIAPSGCPSTPTPTPTATPTPTPTATPGPTATPTPGDTRTVTIPAGGWANFAWSGASSPQTVADCFGAGNVAVMYRLDSASGTFQRWIRGRDDLSNMSDVLRFDALLALNAGAQPATCTMPDDVVPHTLTIPAGRWANFAWLAFSFPAEVAPQACSEGSIAVIYRLDAATQTFQRWIRGRPDLSNMTDVQPYDALLALNSSGQPSTCTFSHYGQLATGSS
jgi:hypothetical protein